MELNVYFKSIIEQDKSPIVICDLSHIIIYMNQSAIDNYSKRGGKLLIGKSLLYCHNESSREKIEKTIEWFKKNINNNIVFEVRNDVKNIDVYIVALRDENRTLIGYYEKHECREREKASPYSFD